MRLPVRYRSATGVARISVTQVLTLAGRIDAQWYTPDAARRGEVIHRWTEAFDTGGPLDLDPALAGYADAYANFIAQVRPVWRHIEHEVQSDRWALGGRIDREAVALFGRPAIVDIKTGAPSAWHAQQLAAYNALRPTGTRWALYLRANGTYRLEQFLDASGYRLFFYDWARVRGMVLADGDHWVPAH